MGAKEEAVRAEFDAFKERVRAETLRVQREQGWATDSLNETLRTLGLPEKREFRIPVTFLIERNANVLVTDQDTEEAARAAVAARNPQILAREVLRAAAGVTSFQVRAAAPTTATETAPAVDDPNPGEGTWYTSDNSDWCRTWSPTRGVCSRPRGHTAGPHVAASPRQVLSVWPVA